MKFSKILTALAVAALSVLAIVFAPTSSAAVTSAQSTRSETVILSPACRLFDDRPGSDGETVLYNTSSIHLRRTFIIRDFGADGTPNRTYCNIPAEATGVYFRLYARRTFSSVFPGNWVEVGNCSTTKPTASKLSSVPISRDFTIASGIAPLALYPVAGAVVNRQICIWTQDPFTQLMMDIEGYVLPAD